MARQLSKHSGPVQVFLHCSEQRGSCAIRSGTNSACSTGETSPVEQNHQSLSFFQRAQPKHISWPPASHPPCLGQQVLQSSQGRMYNFLMLLQFFDVALHLCGCGHSGWLKIPPASIFKAALVLFVYLKANLILDSRPPQLTKGATDCTVDPRGESHHQILAQGGKHRCPDQLLRPWEIQLFKPPR